jgi:hypothetical protein
MHTQAAGTFNVASQRVVHPTLAASHRSRPHSTRQMPCAQVHRQSPWRVSRSLYADLICGDNHMLFIVGVVMVLIAVVIVIIPRMWVPGGVNSANLGWMSEQWLAEHRASHSL